MKKIVIFLLALSFLSVDAQAKKKTTKRKSTKAKTTKKAKAAPAEPAAVVEPTPVVTTPVATESLEENDEPINSLNILNAKSPSTYRKYRDMLKIKVGDSLVSVKNKPIDYGFIDDKDVLRSMVVWEIIDMNEKINQPFYHNADGLVTSNKSLYQILLENINNGKIKEVYDDEMFTTKLSPEQIQQRLKVTVETPWLIDKKNSGEKITPEDIKAGTDIIETTTEKVKLLKIKGMWYVDRRDGQMKYRLLGIAAMGPDPLMMAERTADGQMLGNKDELIDLFWVFYPDAREVLANQIVFNGKNLSSDITYDDVLNARRFSSIIYKSDNGLGTGKISDYIPHDAEEQLEESERIKAQILEMENDMWNY
ncbi:gliding motility protein GldO [Cloacibacterium rupense]|uniref:Gliding motility protein GldO n=1 Tax=Cloacibacterium rupense TaxID=517423 RepID=A0ABQ2NQ72_9FLAO|nr:gliding motility protein GldN [Cloacibacterium rupense]GGP04337.1 gliding motility protein GldO [Cloacibacterium rupense]